MSVYKVAFTGTRRGMTQRQKNAFEMLCNEMSFDLMHGGAVGADEEAGQIAHDHNIHIHVFPSNLLNQQGSWICNEREDPADPIKRNHRMVDICDFLIAAPHTRMEEFRSGTWATIRYAHSVKKPVMILDP